MRELFGRNAFTPHIREAIIERKKQVVRYFKVENTTFKSNGSSDIKRQFVFTEDLELLLDFVISERDYEKANVDVKVSLDGGQGRMLWYFTLAMVTRKKPQKTHQQNRLSS